MRNAFTLTLCCITISASTQNVGIGPIVPTEKLHIHGGAAQTTSIGFTSNSLQAATTSSFKIGLFANAANPQTRYGFLDLPAFTPFYMIQGGFARMHINRIGNVGIGADAIDPYKLLVSGPQIITPGSSPSAALYLVDSTSTPVNIGSGISVSKRLNNQNNFFQFILEGNRSQAYIEANFKNGTANQGVATMKFDSLGRIGIGNYILEKSLRDQLHVFGSQTIEAKEGDRTTFSLHGSDNNLNLGSRIFFSYNQRSPLPGETYQNFFMRLRDRNLGGNANQDGVFEIGHTLQQTTPPSINTSTGFVFNELQQVGIRKFPDKSEAATVKVDISGPVRIAGGLLIQEVGESAGKVLVTDAIGRATWQNPPKITLDQPSPTGQSVIEFRNQGIYVGGLGWSEASSRYFLYDGPTNTNPLLIKNGRIGIGNREPTTNALEVNGNASKATAGDWLANSDARLKKEITPLNNALEKLLQLKGVTYEWNDDKTGTTRPSGKQMGFTAQNIQQVFPQLVSADAQGYLQTSYGTYDALYVEAIKELLQKIQVLEKKIQALQQ
ncbi:tail fiber domain-containing protein [Phnomibacter sp. MR]|uniref:tail fiber domain-containing protein n=1 Tax=Phnomibacter sp. MR TaxID=3042318 RepID=UPI003A7FFE0F